MNSLSIPVHKPKAKKPFHVLSKPAGSLCNLRCDYCFYLSKKELYQQSCNFEMSDELLELYVKGYIEDQPRGCTEVTFGWQGGEPTLRGLDFYRKALVFQNKYQRPGMKVVNTLQTNGVLLNDEWCRFFKEHNFLVGISIDGDRELHDHFRKTSAGKGTYNKVVKGLRFLQKHKVEFNVLTVVQANNGNHGARVYKHLKSLGVSFIQFIPVVEPLEGVGVSERSVSPDQFGQFMLDVFNYWRMEDIGKVFVSHFDNALGMYLGMPSSVCVHATECGTNVVMEHNGDVYSCDHFVYPEFRIGNLQESAFHNLIETPVQQEFSSRKRKGAQLHCQSCSVRRLCNGACPAQRIDEKGKLSVSAPHYLCKGYYHFFSQISPYLRAMGFCIQRGISPVYYKRFMQSFAQKTPTSLYNPE